MLQRWSGYSCSIEGQIVGDRPGDPVDIIAVNWSPKSRGRQGSYATGKQIFDGWPV